MTAHRVGARRANLGRERTRSAMGASLPTHRHWCDPQSNWPDPSCPLRINGRTTRQSLVSLPGPSETHTSLPIAPVRLAVEVSAAITKSKLVMHAAVSSKIASIDAKLNTSDRLAYLATA
jgi:hypothetical protein